MLIQDVMSKDIIKIQKNATLLQAAKVLFDHQVSGLIVVDENDSLVGVLSEKDLYRALYPGYSEFFENPTSVLNYDSNVGTLVDKAKNKTVQEVMSHKVIMVRGTDSAIKAGALMLAKVVNRLPVVDENGKLVGIISRRDIYQKVFRTELGLT